MNFLSLRDYSNFFQFNHEIKNDETVEIRLRIFVGGGVSRVEISVSPKKSIGKGLHDQDLELLFQLLDQTCG